MPNLEEFELAYVDANYDGYLDLIVDDSLYIYSPERNNFEKNKHLEEAPFQSPTDLFSYDLFKKSVGYTLGRSYIEYRSINEDLLPYKLNSYFSTGNEVIKKYKSGKWVTIHEVQAR